VEVDLLPGPERLPVSTVAPALEARRVSKAFVGRAGEATLALRDVDLEVQRGTFVSLIGPSGCGKSTLLRILGGLEQPSTGEVRSTTRQERGGLPSVAFVFQDYGIFPWLSVVDNVAFGLRMAGIGKRERHDRAQAWLARMGLAGFERSYPEQLSGGMRQRLSLARAFVTDPEVLLMDEPMAALDAQTRLLLQEDLVRLWEETKKTVVLVTHSLDEAILLGDRVVAMTARPGRVKLDLPVELPRPRDASSATGVAFSRMKADLWAALRDEVEKSLEHS
jgi:NitT/TauT family transport system ATP-binding protein